MNLSEKYYSFLCALFCAILVIGNIVFQKFINFSISDFLTFQLSAGVLLYPITFLISDLVTEVYGKKHATYMLNCAVIINLIVTLFIYICNSMSAATWSPVNDSVFHQVFGIHSIAIFASLVAIYVSQLVDIFIFAAIKARTNGKHLWLRNIVSTINAQIIDTVCVLVIMSAFHILQWHSFFSIFSDAILFKILAAILTTPLCYYGRFILLKTKK